MQAIDTRFSKLEKNNKSLEKRWELHRSDQTKSLSIIQTGIDSNSAAILELKNVDKANQEKWEELEGLGKEIKKAANKHFIALKEVIKTELKSELKSEVRAEILEEMRSSFTPNTEEIKEGLATIQDRIIKEVHTAQASATADLDY